MLLTLTLVGLAIGISFTGNVERDFDLSRSEVLVARTVSVDAAFGPNGEASPDVGVPPGWPFPTAESPKSGWDIKDVRLAYDYREDKLHVGINCFEICGDADADGDPGRSSLELSARGGTDLANMANSESFAFAIDVDSDGVMDFVMGYPSGENGLSDRYPCGDDSFDTSCFGLYRYDQRPGTSVPSERFVYRSSEDGQYSATDMTPSTSSARPDLEWTINNYNQLRVLSGVPALDSSGGQEWSLNFLAFAGSFQDDGIGEDQIPNSSPFATANFPCANVDECGICGGDGSTCADCLGVPNGSNEYDECDVCAGNDDSCGDCLGVPNGPNTYDVCDVCNGNGPDACGICGGDNSPDCAGTPCGTARYDACGVCDGDSTSCIPEREVCSEEFGNVCKLHPGDVWRGQYRNSPFNVLLAGADVSFTFAPNNYNMEENDLGTHWNRFVITDDYLAVQEFAAAPERVGRQCAPDDVAKYTLKFSPDCRTAEFEAIIEPCRRREALFNGMQITLAKPTRVEDADCSVWTGSGIWQTKYHDRHNAQTGKRQVGTFTFSPFNRAVVESSDSAVYFYHWADETRGDDDFTTVRLMDTGSQDFMQTCGARDTLSPEERGVVKGDKGGLYRIDLDETCMRMKLAFPNEEQQDECDQRAERLNHATLLRVPLPNQDQNTACGRACAARLSSTHEVEECTARCLAYEAHEKI